MNQILRSIDLQQNVTSQAIRLQAKTNSRSTKTISSVFEWEANIVQKKRYKIKPRHLFRSTRVWSYLRSVNKLCAVWIFLLNIRKVIEKTMLHTIRSDFRLAMRRGTHMRVFFLYWTCLENGVFVVYTHLEKCVFFM